MAVGRVGYSLDPVMRSAALESSVRCLLRCFPSGATVTQRGTTQSKGTEERGSQNSGSNIRKAQTEIQGEDLRKERQVRTAPCTYVWGNNNGRTGEKLDC